MRQLQAKGDRLRVDAVRAADLHGVLELERAALEGGAQRACAFNDKLRSLLEHQGLRGITDFVRSEAEGYPAQGFRGPGAFLLFRHGGGKGITSRSHRRLASLHAPT